MKAWRSWPAKLVKRWFAGAFFGLAVNAGALGGALAAYMIILIVGVVLDWGDLEKNDMLMTTAWLWVPLGWFIAAREIVTDDKRDGFVASLRDWIGPERNKG